MTKPQYLPAKYLAILESRHGSGFTGFVRKRAMAIHEADDLHVESLPLIIDEWRKRARSSSYPAPSSPSAPPAPAPIPFERWPRWALWLHKRRQPADQGVGDTLARILNGRGGASFKRWYKAITGHECGCSDRQARLNAQYPYSKVPVEALHA